MQLSDARELTEVEGVKAANAMLQKGWKLLAVTVKTDQIDRQEYTYFVLGKTELPAAPPGLLGYGALLGG